MHHYFVWVLWSVSCIAFAPVIADCISKDLPASVEGCCGNGAAGCWISFESVLGDSIPEVERAVRTCSTKSAVLRMKRDGVNRVDVCHIVLGRVPVALEGEVRTA